MEQYMRFKKQHKDAILFFRMGDFYEMFFDDAKLAAQLLGIALTARNHGKNSGSVPLAGVPHHAMETYVAKLVQMGRKVAICEQVEDPKKAKGVVKRDVVQVISPGTALSDAMLDQQRNNFLAGVYLLGDKAGLAIADLSTGDFSLDEVLAGQLEDELQRLGPAELLLGEGADPAWVKSLERVLPKAAVSRIEDWHFDYQHAYETLTQQLKVHSLKGFDCEDLEAGVRAGGAVVGYLRDNQRGAVEHINRIRRQRRGDYLLIDATAQRNLELLANQQDGGRDGSLLDVIDRTLTPMGARLLRLWVVAPLKGALAIDQRLNAVSALIENRACRDELRDELRQIGDLERVMARICCQRANGRDLVSMARSLQRVPRIREWLRVLADPLTESMAERGLPEVDALVTEVSTALVDEPPATITDGGLIRDGYNAELDELRQISSGGKQWIVRLQTDERERTNISSLKVGFNHVFGYYIEVSKANQDRVPEDYMRKQTLANAERYITPELKEYEAKILGAEERIKELENGLFLKVRERTAIWTPQVQQIARTLAQVDIFAALAELAQVEGYVRPQVDEGGAIVIEGGRHPVVERQLEDGQFVPNDVTVDTETSQVLLITGPNMAGKSTIIRQLGLIVLLAQMGSFVPARRARIGVVDRIFTRVGASDNLARGESTFMVEMNEAANILNNVTPRSLILMDELGRGTSTFDGLSIAWAIVEYLHNREAIQPRTLFATHYHELTELADSLERIKNYNVLVHEEDDHVVFLHRMEPGPCDRSYGINVAQMAGMPQVVVERSKEILARLEKEAIDTDPLDRGRRIAQKSEAEAVGASLGRPPLADADSSGKRLEEIKSALPAAKEEAAGGRSNGKQADKRDTKQDRTGPEAQMALFQMPARDTAGDQLVKELQGIDLSQVTPLQALLKLNEWKEKLARGK